MINAKGGTSIGAMLEGLAQTETGKAVVDKITGKVSAEKPIKE